jgi:hypothetical protein
VLKVRLEGGGSWRVSQAGEVLQPDAEGVYSVSFDRKELTIAPAGPDAPRKN